MCVLSRISTGFSVDDILRRPSSKQILQQTEPKVGFGVYRSFTDIRFTFIRPYNCRSLDKRRIVLYSIVDCLSVNLIHDLTSSLPYVYTLNRPTLPHTPVFKHNCLTPFYMWHFNKSDDTLWHSINKIKVMTPPNYSYGISRSRVKNILYGNLIYSYYLL